MKIRRLLFWLTGTGLIAVAGAGAFLASPLATREVFGSIAHHYERLARGLPELPFLDDKAKLKVLKWLEAKAGKAESQAPAAKQVKVKKMKTVPVVAAAAKTGDIEVHLGALGTVTPLHAVTVRTRIDSQLVRVLFREGQMVKEGQLLAQIDPRPFEVQLAQAEAQMARDRALLANARLDLERYRVLLAQDSVAKQTLDTQQSLVHQYEGILAGNQAAIDNARLQLAYCNIIAPVSGRVGLRQVDPGNWVRTSDPNGIVTVTQLAPITVVFSIPEDRLPAVMTRVRTGERLRVDAYDRAGKARIATGSLVTVDNQIDPTTGTVKLKAVFPNSDERLFPNQFVNVRMLVDVQRGATVIADAAVQRGAQGTFVYAVNADQTVNMRPISLGAGQNGEVSVIHGLKPDELVVIDGADRLRDGIAVELVSPGGPPAAAENEPKDKKKKKRETDIRAGSDA